MPFYQLRGRVRLAERLPSGAPGTFFDPGCPAALSIALSEETFSIIEKCSGFDGEAYRGVRSQSAEITLNLYEATRRNLMLALQGTDVAAQTGGSVVAETLPTGIVATDLVRLGGKNGHQNLSAVTITDAGGPMTLTTEYLIHEDSGMIEFLVTPVAPVTASYTYDDMPKVAMFAAGSKEYYVAFDARNKADNFAPAVAELFRIRFGPLANLDLLPDEVSTFELTGSALVDDTRDVDDALGQFGWLSYVAA